LQQKIIGRLIHIFGKNYQENWTIEAIILDADLFQGAIVSEGYLKMRYIQDVRELI
jgi:hypothetical protein